MWSAIRVEFYSFENSSFFRNLPKSPQASMRGYSWNLVTSFNVEWIHGCQCSLRFSFEFQLQVQVSSFAIFQDVICGGPLLTLPSHCMLPLMAVLRLRTRLMRHYRKRKKKGKSFAQLVGLRCVAWSLDLSAILWNHHVIFFTQKRQVNSEIGILDAQRQELMTSTSFQSFSFW